LSKIRRVIYGSLFLVTIAATVVFVVVSSSDLQSSTTFDSVQPRVTTNSYAVESLSERIKDLPPEEQELVKNAKKVVGMHKGKDGKWMLVEVDGKIVHPDPNKEFGYGVVTDKEYLELPEDFIFEGRDNPVEVVEQ